MTTSDTPRTDIVQQAVYAINGDLKIPKAVFGIARTLERERAALTAEVERLRKALERSQGAEADLAAMLIRAEKAETENEPVALLREVLQFDELDKLMGADRYVLVRIRAFLEKHA